MSDINPQAVKEAKTEITQAIDENVENLEKEEYKEVLEDLIDDLRARLESVEMELEDEPEGEE